MITLTGEPGYSWRRLLFYSGRRFLLSVFSLFAHGKVRNWNETRTNDRRI